MCSCACLVLVAVRQWCFPCVIIIVCPPSDNLTWRMNKLQARTYKAQILDNTTPMNAALNNVKLNDCINREPEVWKPLFDIVWTTRPAVLYVIIICHVLTTIAFMFCILLDVWSVCVCQLVMVQGWCVTSDCALSVFEFHFWVLRCAR